MKKFTKTLLIGLLVITFIISISGCGNSKGQQGTETKNVIAEYTGGQVTQTEFDLYLSIREFFNPNLKDQITNQDLKKQLLDQLIAEEYLSSKNTADITTYDNDVNNLIATFKQQWVQQLGSEEKYISMLKDSNITEKDLFNYIRRVYAVQDYLVEKAYKKNKEEFTIATVSHILIIVDDNRTDEAAKKRAEEVLAKLKAGGDFAALAKEYSDDPGSKDNGGVYKDTPVLSWVPEFKNAALTLPINELSGLVKTDYGYHIIKVLDRTIPKLDEVTDEQKNSIFSQEYNNFLTNDLPSVIKSVNLGE